MKYIKQETITEKIKNGMKKFMFHTKISNNGVNRIYIGGNPTTIYAGGSGYDKESTVLAYLINDVVGERDYGNVYTGSYSGVRKICAGISVGALTIAFEKIGGKLEHIYSGNDFDVYEIDFSNIEGI